MSDFKYQAFWCEENIWHLAQHPRTAATERLVVVITGAARQVACWQQRAGEPGEAVLWDYHVTLATRDDGWWLWDLDTRLPLPVAANVWLSETFPYPQFVPTPFHPRFALFDADAFVRGFGSNRTHMQGPRGQWTQPPPPWPAIAGSALMLSEAIAQAREGMTLEQMRQRWR